MTNLSHSLISLATGSRSRAILGTAWIGLAMATAPALLRSGESPTETPTAATAANRDATSQSPASPIPSSGSPPLPQKRSELTEFLQQLSNEQRQELDTQRQQFDQLTAIERDRLRQLHARIQADPQSQELNQVLEQYSVWLSSLPLKERMAIQDLKPSERIERIRDLRRREQDSRLTQLGLTNRDTQTIIDWIQKQVIEHEEELVKTLTPPEKNWRDRAPSAEERRAFMFLRPDRLKDLLKLVTSAEYNRLAEQLQPSAQSRLLATSDDEKDDARMKMVEDWIHASFMTRFRPPEVSKEKLLEFLEKELPENVREELESLPRDRFYAELRNRYNMQRNRSDRWGQRGERRGGGRPERGDRRDDDRPSDREGGRRRGFGPGGREGRPPRPGEGGPSFGPDGDRMPPDFGPPPEGPPPEDPPPEDPPRQQPPERRTSKAEEEETP